MWKMDKFHLIIACWGKEYVDMFLNVALPCHLSPGNLPAICDNHDLLYKIYTTKEDEARIGNHPAFLKLKALVKTRVITIDPTELLRKLTAMMLASSCSFRTFS
jgi:hypothetical protein